MNDIELYESSWKLAQRVNLTPFVPKAMQGKPEHVLACVLYGRELGLGPMQSLNSIHVIEGRAAASPELMRALVANAGHRIDVLENTNEKCVMKGVRNDTDATATVQWTVEDAKLANLTGKDNWKKYPRAMLAARATSELCRLLFPDVIAGLSYTPEEVESINDASIVAQTVKASVVASEPEETEAVVIEDAEIVETPVAKRAVLGSMARHGSPDREVGGPEAGDAPRDSGPLTDSEDDVQRAIELTLQAFPGSEVIEEGELIDSQSIEQRRAEIKTWGIAWPRLRAIAIPLARSEGMLPPANIEEFITNHQLYTLVAKAVKK